MAMGAFESAICLVLIILSLFCRAKISEGINYEEDTKKDSKKEGAERILGMCKRVFLKSGEIFISLLFVSVILDLLLNIVWIRGKIFLLPLAFVLACSGLIFFLSIIACAILWAICSLTKKINKNEA